MSKSQRRSRRSSGRSKSHIKKRKAQQKKESVNHSKPLVNALVAEHWDNAKSMVENYRQLGLATDVNAGIGDIARQAKRQSLNRKMVIQVEDKSADNGLISKELNNIQNAEPAPARVATTMSEFEVAELKALRNRFGDDFEAMSRDIKLNKWQKTAAQLCKRFKLFDSLPLSNTVF